MAKLRNRSHDAERLVPLILLMALLSLPAVSYSGTRKPFSFSQVNYYDTTVLNANRIVLFLNNQGNLDLGYGSSGGYWTRNTPPLTSTIVFDQGLWVIGKYNGVVGLALSQWLSSYSPGPIINGQPALNVHPEDSLRYRVYTFSRGDDSTSNPDYAQWPLDLGAPLDSLGKPKLYGDQTVWTIYNNADTTRTSTFRDNFPHLPIEVHQLAFAHAGTDCDSTQLLANVVFIEWTIVNKGAATIDSAYIGLWTDIDFESILNNIPAIDTINQLTYCWNNVQSPTQRQRAVGYVWLYGPTAPSSGDAAIVRGQHRIGYKNLPLTSFWGIIDDSLPDSSFLGPAYSVGTAWNIARGLDKSGQPIIDSITHQPTKFPYSGDPATGTGWVYSLPYHGGGSGFNLFSGPVTILPNDTQWVMAALVPAVGNSRAEALQQLKNNARLLRSMPYDSLVYSSFVHTECFAIPPASYRLLQNYPNPFNLQTTIAFDISAPTHTRLRVFDLLGRTVVTLVDEIKMPGSYNVTFDGSRLASGVYFYRLEAGSYVAMNKLVLLR